MDIILAALLVGKSLLPEVDQSTLELQSQAEAMQPRLSRPAPVRRASSSALDLDAITTICRAAGQQSDPASFVARLSRAYALSSDEARSLRSSCAAYLAGRAEAARGD